MRPIKTGYWVRTADGAIGQVRYVGKTYDGTKYTDELYADVALENAALTLDGGTVALPVTELRRVADPYRKRPPITGMPLGEDRPVCAMCGRRLAPVVETMHDAKFRIVSRKFICWQKQYGPFHSSACAVTFAQLAYKAGYRITKR